MTILQEILKWSQGLPAWQQDAIARLYMKPDLEAQDFDDLYALLKSAHGISDPNDRVPSILSAEQMAAPQASARLVQLAAIKNLRNVNALAEGQRLPINPNGLSVIYGENGTGKSGYSRVFKKACRARDQRESIYPNAHKEPSKIGPAQATFELIVDGAPVEVEWTFGKEAPEQLSSIAIFDSHCARAYVDNHGDFAYVPYGLDILEKLVNVCTKLRTMATKEQADNEPNVELFAALSKTQTQVGKLLASLSEKNKPEDIEALATWTETDQERFTTLNKTLAEADPKQKAQVLKLRATRFTSLSTRIGAAIDAINDVNIANLRSLIEKSKVAKQAADLAGKQFKENHTISVRYDIDHTGRYQLVRYETEIQRNETEFVKRQFEQGRGPKSVSPWIMTRFDEFKSLVEFLNSQQIEAHYYLNPLHPSIAKVYGTSELEEFKTRISSRTGGRNIADCSLLLSENANIRFYDYKHFRATESTTVLDCALGTGSSQSRQQRGR